MTLLNRSAFIQIQKPKTQDSVKEYMIIWTSFNLKLLLSKRQSLENKRQAMDRENIL